MSMLESGVDLSTIAIWLGHENVQTTHKYMVADMARKEDALAKVHPAKRAGELTRKQIEKILEGARLVMQRLQRSTQSPLYPMTMLKHTKQRTTLQGL